MTPYQMPPRESLYLDLVRALAAFVVVLDHAPTVFDIAVPRWGHQAVIVFFVLSGYVISHTADHRERTARAFLVARFARLWSVLVPAMVLTIACDTIGRHFGLHPDTYRTVPADHPVVRTLAILGFVSESWLSIQPFSNGVVWSLCCEFWYYMIFAAWCFVPKGPWRLAAIALACLCAGHEALLLLPIWLLGVALQRLPMLRGISLPSGVGLCGIATAAIAWALATRVYDPAIALMAHATAPFIFTQLAQARVFWLDWLFGLAVAVQLLGARAIIRFVPLERIAAPVRWGAGVSFAAYLLHEPLLQFCAAWLSRRDGWIAIGLSLAAIALLGPPIEASKRQWRRLLNAIAERLEGIRPGDLRAAAGGGDLNPPVR